jgi:hypothetical protein
VCQRLYVHFDEAHHEKCISSMPSDEVGKIAKSSVPAAETARRPCRRNLIGALFVFSKVFVELLVRQ